MQVKIVSGELPQPDPNGPPPPGVTEVVVRRNGGPPTIERIVDIRHPNFGDALGWVFAQNVKAAREENTRLTGNPDGRLPPVAHD